MNFVFVSLQRINTDRESTSTNLARELARQNHNVLYVNSPVNRKDYFIAPESPFVAAHLQAIKSKAAPLQELAPHLWVLYPTQPLESFNWVPSTPLFLWLIKFNNRRFGKEIQKAVQDLGFDDYILVNDKDIFRSFYLKEILNPRKYVYMDRDYTVGAPYWLRHGPSLEPALMRKADAVVCNSLDFTKRAQFFNPNSFYIGNGFDVAQFNISHSASVPSDLKRIPGPRIGYVGALITLRLDLNLLIEVARARPNWSFVLIGTEDEAFALSTLHKLPNVFFLGYKHTREVPAYLLHFDVCINPQVLNDFTRSNFPLKILEYLALGKPVVATETNTMNEVFAEHTYLATGAAEYLVQIDKALAEDNEALAQKRVDYAKKFSWEHIAKLFIQHLQTL
ncbi:glycosyltransferase [Hymenobacter wooponensis]|uniref:Glycosyltransferase family 1 protein n=1 Tax=Hymenobacter wooponensis TaxID=1525360 RepID=A0A4Z0MK18_9BACT|nr:glycosyltransferase [Hymenobacter wooponensis]TGD79628.1 glycosyltransferase family 1 protein [Hymenobacter wooponensis]